MDGRDGRPRNRHAKHIYAPVLVLKTVDQMRKTLLASGGIMAAIGSGAAYYFHTATYEVERFLLSFPYTTEEHYDPILVAASIVLAIAGVAILIYGAMAKDSRSG